MQWVAVSTRRCKLCLAMSHTEQECAQRQDPDPGMGERLQAIESVVLLQKGKNRKSQWPRLQYWRKHAENSTARGVPIPTAGTAMSAAYAGETTQPAGVPLALPRVQGPREQPRRATHTNSTGSNNLSRLCWEQQLVPLPLANNNLYT